MELKDKVKHQLEIKHPDFSEAQVDEYVSRAEEYFLATTKRTEVPDKAFWLWVDLSDAFYKDSTGSSSAAVTSVKRGDTTISYADTAAGLSDVAALRNKLNAYKVVVAR